MAGKARTIVLTEGESERLESLLHNGRAEQRLVQRARIVLESAAGRMTKEIARTLELRPATVSKWRGRFASQRTAGLSDAPRPGARRKYGMDTELCILSVIENPPPDGRATWTASLVANALGNVSDDHVWRVLRQHGISLQQHRRP
ncbi:MAG: helix-turn-helix domain-containing protein [Chloroflexi bacterium]|nr:helix-turn-helix domain-containing protein [Chloroflexota bacterium]